MMRTRLFALVLLVTSVAFASPGWAQSASDEAATNLARERFKEGVAYFDKGHFEQARGAFLQAYTLRRHPAILANLAWSCLRSNHFLEAHRYFQQFLSESKDISAAQRADIQDGLNQADARLGPNEISAASSPAPEPTPEPPPVSPRPTPRVAEAPATPEQPQAPPTETTITSEPLPESHRSSFWPENMLPVYIGGGVVIASAAVAIGASIAKQSAQDNATTETNMIIANQGSCPAPSTASSSRLRACATLVDDKSQWDQDATLGNVAIGVGVAALVGTVVYWFVAKKRGDEVNKPATAMETKIIPIVGPSFGGLSASTTF
jgi:hypothetical protein